MNADMNSDLFDVSKVKVEELSDQEVGLPSLPTNEYEKVMGEISDNIESIDTHISSFPLTERSWFEAEVAKNVAKIKKGNKWTRKTGAKQASKYQKMILAQKRIAMQKLQQLMKEDQVLRSNPSRAARCEISYKEESDDDVKFVKEVKSKRNSKKKNGIKKNGH